MPPCTPPTLLLDLEICDGFWQLWRTYGRDSPDAGPLPDLVGVAGPVGVEPQLVRDLGLRLVPAALGQAVRDVGVLGHVEQPFGGGGGDGGRGRGAGKGGRGKGEGGRDKETTNTQLKEF